LGFEVLDEWYFVGEYMPKKMQEMTRNGRLGDITGRPNEWDLQEVKQPDTLLPNECNLTLEGVTLIFQR
jgi:hypothetical protein